MIFSANQVRLLLEALSWETVVKPSERFPFRVCRRSHGYSDDPEIGRLQATLSMCLEACAQKAEKQA